MSLVTRGLLLLAACLAPGFPGQTQPQVAISEVMYHPVERPAFQPDGRPLLDLSDDVHEFVELHNFGTNAANLSGWRLSGGIAFTFPAGTLMQTGQFLVVAKYPARIATVYGLNVATILGPWTGKLANDGDALRLHDNTATIVDALTYSASSPWAIGANALGAEDEYTGLNSSAYQYRGRSLERVSVTVPANDPANWLASPLAAGPSPGRTNFVRLASPRPVALSFSVLQQIDGERIIRAAQPVRLEATFSGTNALSSVSVEYFVDNIDVTNETRSTVAMSVVGGAGAGRFAATLPGQVDRSVVRFRLRANRGAGVETVSPRADDPFAWQAYFVTPLRSSTKPIYDLFLSQASLNTLSTNITQSPRRVSLPDPPGWPRASWNATEPGIFVVDGVVRDIRVRYHGSRYSRQPGRLSMKWQFPRYHRFEGREGIFETDKLDYFIAGHGLFEAAGLPTSRLRHVDVYLNNNGALDRLEQEENDDFMLERYHAEQHALNPGQPREAVGEIYKCEGILPPNFEGSDGPYGIGSFIPLPAIPPYWTSLQRYEYTWALQDHGWKGAKPFKDMSESFWAARGDSPAAPNPNIPAVRAWLEQNFDMDATLTYMAFREWGAAYDHITQNYFLWRRASGKWALLPWDFDDEYYEPFVNWSIYQGEVGDPNVTERGPNYLYDAIYKAFRTEYKERLFILNHTLLNPTNISALGFGGLRSAGGGTMRGYADQRFSIVDQKLGLGVFHSPVRPANVLPASGAAALLPATLQASAYAHTATPGSLHASTTWFIRAAGGNYLAPVLRLTSTTNLTSLPIPFDKLSFGETYFWKCLFTDANGHPSLESAETSFVFGPAPVTLPLVAIDATTLWKFEQSGNPAPANWNQPAFDDSAWPAGPALLAQETCGCLPEPIRTTLTLGNKITLYFRTRFVFPGPTSGVTLRLRQVIDDAVVIYLNGVEVSRSRLPAGPITSTTTASLGVGDAVYEGPFTIPATALVTGTNVLAAEVHQSAAGSSDIVFGFSLEAIVPSSTAGSILISEILADNRSAVTNGDTTPDFVEIQNTTDLPQNISGMSLSDDVAQPGRFVFPSGTVISPRGLLVVWCDDDAGAPGLHSGFGLDNDGQTLALFNATPTGWTLGDYVTFGLQATDYSIGRVAGGWQLTVPTPNATNVAAALAPPTALTINEWMASTTTGPDWFELFNSAALPVALGGLYLSDDGANVTNTGIRALSFIAPRGWRQFISDENQAASARHVDFKLSGNGEAILLSDASRALIDRVTFGAQTVNVSQGRLPDGSTSILSFPGSASPDAANFLLLPDVVISEVLSHSEPPALDLIELHNTGVAPLDISGWWLSDDGNVLQKFRLATNTVISAGGFVVLHASQFTNGLVPFGLSGAHGDELFLSAADAVGNLTGARTSVKLGAAAAGVSHGRIHTSTGVDFGALTSPTFGGANASPLIGPVVISEIQYHPPDLDGDDDDYEFIELQNITAAPVEVFDAAFPSNRWRLRDAVNFTFPSNTTLAAGERVLVTGFDPLTNAPVLAAFRSVYGLSPAVRLFGPYRGKLDNTGASVELARPDAPVSVAGPDFGFVPSLLVDRVHYSDHAPWPDSAGGFGSSLQRRGVTVYGNEPTNWFAAGLSAGAPSRTNAAPSVVLTAPAPNAVLRAGLNINLAASASDTDGTVRRVEFLADGMKLGEDTSAPFTFSWLNPAPGPHLLTARAFDDGLASALSVGVVITVTNQPPTVVLTSPLNGAAFLLPTNILLQVTATDPDGSVQRVEYYDNGAKLGETTNAPFSLLWSNAGGGTHALTARALDNFSLAATSAPVTITATRSSYIAYLVEAGTTGDQDYGLGLGLDFDVVQRILVPRLGVFDSGGDGISDTLTVQIFNRTTTALLTTLIFNNAAPGALEPGTGSRFKSLPAPLALPPGQYTVVSFGHNATDLNGNSGNPRPKQWSTDNGGGLINFVGQARYGFSGPGVYPAELDNGPADRYAAGTFEYLPLLPPVIVQQPASVEVVAGQSATLNVAASGTFPLSYRWLRNGVTVAGQTSATLTLASAQYASSGNYSVIITNHAGSVTSAGALLTVLDDTDHDGMPDAWESAHGLNPAVDDASLDADGDGATNLQEYLAGTNPQSATSYLKLVIANTTQPILEFLAASNKSYTILWRPAANTTPWNNLADIPAATTNRVFQFTDPAADSTPQRFYRLVTPQQP